MTTEKFLSTREVAQILNVKPDTVAGYIRTRKIKPRDYFRPCGRGPYRISARWVESQLNGPQFLRGADEATQEAVDYVLRACSK